MAAPATGARDYRLVTMGYASPFPAGRWIRYPEERLEPADRGRLPGLERRRRLGGGRRASTRSSPRCARAAAAAGAEFLDLRHALDGHQLCDRRSRRVGPAGPSPASAEWVRRLAFVQGSSRESLHPNAYGQRAIGACIGLLYASPRGDYACRATPGRGYVDGDAARAARR